MKLTTLTIISIFAIILNQVMCDCPEAHYPTFEKGCQPCIPNCKDCFVDKDFCKECYPGYVVFKYYIERTRCDPDCRANENNCKICKNDDIPKEGCQECSDGYGVNQYLMCSKCTDKNCANCSSDVNTCTKCKTNFTLSEGSCLDECISGKNNCKECNKDKSKGCSTCADGFKPNKSNICKPSCQEKDNCEKCHDDELKGCLHCKEGFRPKDIGCEKCSVENCSSCSVKADVCEICKEGFLLDNKKCIACKNNECKCGANCLECGAKTCQRCKGTKRPKGANCDGEEVKGAYILHTGKQNNGIIQCDLSQGYIFKNNNCTILEENGNVVPKDVKQCLYGYIDADNNFICNACKGDFIPKKGGVANAQDKVCLQLTDKLENIYAYENSENHICNDGFLFDNKKCISAPKGKEGCYDKNCSYCTAELNYEMLKPNKCTKVNGNSKNNGNSPSMLKIGLIAFLIVFIY